VLAKKRGMGAPAVAKAKAAAVKTKGASRKIETVLWLSAYFRQALRSARWPRAPRPAARLLRPPGARASSLRPARCKSRSKIGGRSKGRGRRAAEAAAARLAGAAGAGVAESPHPSPRPKRAATSRSAALSSSWHTLQNPGVWTYCYLHQLAGGKTRIHSLRLVLHARRVH